MVRASTERDADPQVATSGKRPLDGAQERFARERLRQELRARLRREAFLAVTGDVEHSEGSRAAPPQLRDELGAAGVRHHQVGDDEIDPKVMLCRLIECGLG